MGTRIVASGGSDEFDRDNMPSRRGMTGLIALCIALSSAAADAVSGEADRNKADHQTLAQGRELFDREWQPGDSRSPAGDGLGPVFNDTSCVACHNLGGTGGAGSTSKNVQIISATADIPAPNDNATAPNVPVREQGFLASALASLVGLDVARRATPGQPVQQATTNPPPRSAVRNRAPQHVDTTALVKAHPGFKTARSLVLHHFGTDDQYATWRGKFLGIDDNALPVTNVNDQSVGQSDVSKRLAMLRAISESGLGSDPTTSVQIGQFAVVGSQRNPTALFGLGLIDSIPGPAIEAAARKKHQGFPEIAGRVSMLKDKRVGRFGWKAQTASLSDFVLTACAVELGLEVPGHHQAGSPQKPEYLAKGLDLTSQECDSLVAFIRDIPRPVENVPATKTEMGEIASGRALFANVGCATCHTPKLGDVEGLYSDLLLHDLGPALGDTGQYGTFDPSSSEDEIIDDAGPIAESTDDPLRPAGNEVLKRFQFAASSGAPAGSPAEAAPSRESDRAMLRMPSEAPPQLAQTDAAGPERSLLRPTSGPASRFEWRTPALWGFRDSGPYLHDGRAATLDQAVGLHDGESRKVTMKYFELSVRQRRQVEMFLKTLTAPAPRSS
jgi:CxxC motif-containing protein (DUF1111 family)